MTELIWERNWARKYSPLLASAFMRAFTQDNEFGESHHKMFVPEGNLMAYYFEKSEYAMVVSNFEKFLRSQDLAEYAPQYESEVGVILDFAEKIKDIDPAEIDSPQRKELVNQLRDKMIHSGTYQFCAFLVLSGPATELERRMADIPDGERLMRIITTPYKHTQITEAHLELLQIAVEGGKSKLRAHAEKYAWIPVYDFMDHTWTERDFFEQYESLKNPTDELAKAEKTQAENLAAYQEYLSTIEDQEFKKLVEIVHYFSFLKEVRDDYRRKAYWLLQPFLHKLAPTLGLTFEELNFLSLDEVSNSILSGSSIVNKKEISVRQRSFAMIYDNNELRICSGEEAVVLGRKMLPETSSELKGMIASRGKVKGKVSIIYHQGEFAKFQDGDVLVTTMTHPEFLQIMRRASAIVTDEGGITCHAAIVARELGIPCIIGVKNATQALKDGDMIEVDAEEGIVRII